MVFSSLLFLTLFLPLTVALYALLPGRCRNLLLLVASLLFYAWGEPIYLALMLVTTLYVWLLGLGVGACLKEQRRGAARFLLVLCLVLSLGTLAYFKYFGFFLSLIPGARGSWIAPPLPIGISFYTFQALSYLIDVYRGEVEAQRSWLRFAMYLSLFPQLIAGPIVRYSDVEQQLGARPWDLPHLSAGIRRFTVGLCKKVLLANQIGLLWEEISSAGSLSVLGAWLGALAFALQIYFDFSAYSDMAVGLGRMFGFSFPENFRYPYESKSITEFWRRWHITLGTWFREYVYIPLGGNRRGRGRQIWNLFVVWSLTGLWHGADWQFLLWGLYYFVLLALEKRFALKWMERWPGFLRRLTTLILVTLGWVLFACPDVPAAGAFYRAMLGIRVPLADDTARFLLSCNGPLLLCLMVGATELPRRCWGRLETRLGPRCPQTCTDVGCILLLWVCVAFLVADTYNPFLYFRF